MSEFLVFKQEGQTSPLSAYYKMNEEYGILTVVSLEDQHCFFFLGRI